MRKQKVDENAAMEILQLLMEKCPEAVRHADNIKGGLPIHRASMRRSVEFCRVLIEAYPGSERITDAKGMLTLHWACVYNTVAVVEYLYKLYPDAINHETRAGYPIHLVITNRKQRVNPAAAADILKFLLKCVLNVASQELRSLLHFACRREYNDSNMRPVSNSSR
jgi:ankyrin repeat protein